MTERIPTRTFVRDNMSQIQGDIDTEFRKALNRPPTALERRRMTTLAQRYVHDSKGTDKDRFYGLVSATDHVLEEAKTGREIPYLRYKPERVDDAFHGLRRRRVRQSDGSIRETVYLRDDGRVVDRILSSSGALQQLIFRLKRGHLIKFFRDDD